MICPNISWFHTVVTILALRYRISRQTSHPLHLPHAASWIFDKIIPRLQLFNKFQHMPIHSVTEFCILTDWFQTPCSRILSSVMTDCRNAERGAVRTCPYHIRCAKETPDVISCHLTDIFI